MSEEPKKLGIEELLDVIIFADKLVGEMKKAKADDGKISKDEILKIIAATMPEAMKAVMGVWKTPSELADLDAKEKEQLFTAGLSVIVKLVELFIGDMS